MMAGLKFNATEGVCACMHLLLMQSVSTASTAHLQVGVNVNLDATFLARDYGVTVKNTADVRAHASECWVETPSRSLAGMVSSLLGKELPKDPTVRLSRWSHRLDDNQVILGSPERDLLVLVQFYRVWLVMASHILGFWCYYLESSYRCVLMISHFNNLTLRHRCSMPAWMRWRPFLCFWRSRD